MNKLLFILIISIILFSCGKKSDPEYQGQKTKNNITHYNMKINDNIINNKYIKNSINYLNNEILFNKFERRLNLSTIY